MWRVETTSRYEAAALEFVKTHVQQFIVLMSNLHHYRFQLLAARNYSTVEAKYLHDEGNHVLSIDHQDAEPELEQVYLYVFPDGPKYVLYLLAIGKASEKHADIEYCKNTVAGLMRA
jgi:hypothetical protein